MKIWSILWLLRSDSLTALTGNHPAGEWTFTFVFHFHMLASLASAFRWTDLLFAVEMISTSLVFFFICACSISRVAGTGNLTTLQTSTSSVLHSLSNSDHIFGSCADFSWIHNQSTTKWAESDRAIRAFNIKRFSQQWDYA